MQISKAIHRQHSVTCMNKLQWHSQC